MRRLQKRNPWVTSVFFWWVYHLLGPQCLVHPSPKFFFRISKLEWLDSSARWERRTWKNLESMNDRALMRLWAPWTSSRRCSGTNRTGRHRALRNDHNHPTVNNCTSTILKHILTDHSFFGAQEKQLSRGLPWPEKINYIRTVFDNWLLVYLNRSVLISISPRDSKYIYPLRILGRSWMAINSIALFCSRL